MKRLARIVVAVDDSPTSEGALAEAIALAKASGAELVLAHVASILGERVADGRSVPNRVPDASRTVLAAAGERARAAGVVTRAELLVGHPPKQLALLAEDVDADLIVVGTHRYRGVKRAVLGSTSHELLKGSTRPVLVVPPPALTAAA